MNDPRTVVIHRTSFEVLSASTDSYSFIGSRFYHTFDHLVDPEDRALFCRETEACSGEPFPLRLLDEAGAPVLHIARAARSANPHAVVLTLASVTDLIPLLEQQRERLTLKNHVLSIYGDEYFEYSAASGLIRIYRVDKYEQTIAEATPDDFFARMASFVQPGDREVLDQFRADFLAHRANLYLRADGHLLEKRDASLTVIKGRSLFENGIYTGAAGVIHFGARRNASESIASERDSLTGLLPKSEITATAIGMIDMHRVKYTTIAIVDVDHFKAVNDTFGHMAGDEVLRRVASVLVDEVGSHGLVGRIGGDEFMVIYFHVGNMENNRELVRSIKNRVAAIYPPGNPDSPCVTLSIGCAAFPKDADSYEDVFRLADFAMYRAKHNGRNRYVIFDEAKHGKLADILKTSMIGPRLNSRGEMTAGDLMCDVMSRVFRGEGGPIGPLLEETAVELGLQRVILYAGTPLRAVCMGGQQRPDDRIVNETAGYLDDPTLLALVDKHGVMVLDDTERAAAMGLPFYASLKALGVLSCIHVRGLDAAGQPYVLSIESVKSRITWNPELVRIYALFQRVLAEYRLT